MRATLLMLLGCSLLGAAMGQGMHTQVLTLDYECDQRLDALLGNYTDPTMGTVDGCDSACQADCKEVIEKAIYTEKVQDCPLQDEITKCFHVYSDEWEDYVKDCALFEFSATSGSSSSSGTAEGSRRRLLAASEGGSGSSDVNNGCFPFFADAEDFEHYIDGLWFTSDKYDEPSNAGGIALSVVFFVSLATVGIFLKY